MHGTPAAPGSTIYWEDESGHERETVLDTIFPYGRGIVEIVEVDTPSTQWLKDMVVYRFEGSGETQTLTQKFFKFAFRRI